MAHFSLASLFQIGSLLILICWTKESTGAAFSLEEEFLQLKEHYIQMKEIVKNLESKVTNLEDKVAQQDSLIFDLLLREKNNERTAASNHFESAPMNTNQSAVVINGLPSSCGDLKIIGHTLNGFYSIVGSAMLESVYCDFNKLATDADFQKWIGYVDVKSAPVHFYVQRNSNFDLQTTIPFDSEVLNEGNAMNLASGIFTAPQTGVYFFSFTGLARFPPSSSYVYLNVILYLNGRQIGLGRAEDANTVDNQFSPLSSLQSTLNLIKGDQVWVEITGMSSGVYLLDNINYHYTHFTGFMLEEEIVASL